MTDKTSDYWQGDEAKFKKSFNGGAGAVFVDDVSFDKSSQTYSVQVSVPVKEGDTSYRGNHLRHRYGQDKIK